MHMPQSILAYESRDEANTTAETIANTRQWINDAVEHLEQLMRRIIQPNQTVEALCTFRGVPEHLFTASRVRVAILDSEVDVESAVFAPYRARIKGYEDFRAAGPRPILPLSTHGTDVTSLFLHMAPDADVFVARAFDDRVSLIKVWIAIYLLQCRHLEGIRYATIVANNFRLSITPYIPGRLTSYPYPEAAFMKVMLGFGRP